MCIDANEIERKETKAELLTYVAQVVRAFFYHYGGRTLHDMYADKFNLSSSL